MIKKLSFISFFAALLLLGSCKDDSLAPIVTFDQLGKGAYVRLVELISGEYDLKNFETTAYEYSIEFVDLENGNLVRQYDLAVTYKPKSGDNQGPTLYKSFSSDQFQTLASGRKGMENIKIPLKEVADLFGLTEADISAGDQFAFDGTITTTDGRTFGAENSSAAINGSAFQGHFDFTVKATCPLPDDKWSGTYELSYDDAGGDPTAGFGTPFPAGDVEVTTVPGSTTLRQFSAQWGCDIGCFDVDPLTFDFVCTEVVVLDWDSGLACGGGSITIVQDGSRPSPVADLADDSVIVLNIIEYQDDGECGIDPAPKTIVLTKK